MFYFQESVRRLLPSWLSPDQRSRGITADYLFSAATANWERKRPVWVMMMLDSLTRSDVASRGVPVLDLHLAEIAKRTGKKLVSRTFCRVVIVVVVVVVAAAAAAAAAALLLLLLLLSLQLPPVYIFLLPNTIFIKVVAYTSIEP